MKTFMRERRILLLGAVVAALIAAVVFIASCGSEYEQPAYQTTGPLIEAETLKSWIDAGKVNGTGYDRVVILEVNMNAGTSTGQASYAAAHIPGAHYVALNEIEAQRVEGLAPAPGMVIGGAQMDAIIRRAGIDKNTTIVFTSSHTSGGNYLFAARGYFTFRYWGFPKERLKFLNGINRAYNAAYGGDMTTVVPTVAPSMYSVKNNAGLRADLRASIGEVIQAAGNPQAQFLDMRGANAYNGTLASTSVTFTTATGTSSGPVVFEGHVIGAAYTTTNDLVNTTDNYRFKTTEELSTLLGTTLGLSSGKRTYIYCTLGRQASSAFFVLDALLNWPVELYDGSWAQWGLYTTTTNGGKLTVGSAWDAYVLSTISAAAPYAAPNLNVAPYADFTTATGYSTDPALHYTTPADGRANQIEIEDAAYIGTDGSGGGGTPSISPGC